MEIYDESAISNEIVFKKAPYVDELVKRVDEK